MKVIIDIRLEVEADGDAEDIQNAIEAVIADWISRRTELGRTKWGNPVHVLDGETLLNEEADTAELKG